MNSINNYKLYLRIIFVVYCLILSALGFKIAQSENSEIEITADTIEVIKDDNKINATGNTIIQTEEFLSTSDSLIYDKNLESIKTSGNIIIKDNLENYYFFDDFISDKGFNKANGTNTRIRLSDGTRIVGKSFIRTDSNINEINNAEYTPCLQNNYIVKNCPGWKLTAKKVIHDEEKQSVYYEGATLSILNVPVLYSPFFSHPDPTVKKKSGILMPSVSSDNNLGNTFSIPYFYNISSNYDLTITPTFQTKADNYYTLNYRHLTKNHMFNMDTSITDNESKAGTRNHIFINGDIKNPYGKFNYKIETANNDTYLRKNQINEQTIFTSGLNFTKEMENSLLDFSSYIYKHLNNSNEQKWEYVYPNINYDIYDYKDPVSKTNWSISNSFLNYRTIDKDYKQQLSSEIFTNKIQISKQTGLKFENTIQNRLIYFNSSTNDYNQLRIFPQISSKISLPLSKSKNKRTQILEPVIMPILAPYNNYSNDQSISNGNIFSLNRETSLSQWESGPRINYGLNWLVSNENLTVNTSFGQSTKFKKDNTTEISNYFIGNTLDFGSIGYIKSDITIDRQDLYLKDNNINSSLNFDKIKFGFDYDYETSNKIKTSEQISIGAKVNFYKDTNLIMSVRKDLMSDKSIGNAFGIHYENDCLAINFDYFRDFTAIDDIENSRGFSFTITLKPFGTSKQAGKIRNFGPDL
ncbi:MAG: LPS-assembly protein LptD [Pelagibacterales bacterium]|nr:LPS-assembly protein LptD [Pelagibacterales bacterium]